MTHLQELPAQELTSIFISTQCVKERQKHATHTPTLTQAHYACVVLLEQLVTHNSTTVPLFIINRTEPFISTILNWK